MWRKRDSDPFKTPENDDQFEATIKNMVRPCYNCHKYNEIVYEPKTEKRLFKKYIDILF